MAAEEQQVQVELARTPVLALAAAELALEVLERHQEIGRARGGIGPAGHVEGDDGVQEVGLIDHADGPGSIEARDATEASAGQGAERRHGICQRPARVADVRPKPDVRPNASAHDHLDRPRSAPGYSRRVQPVAVRILHPQPGEDAGELTRLVASARAIAANELARRFRVATDDVRVVRGTADGRSFGERLRGIAGDVRAGAGLIVLGSGSIPLATDDDVALLVGVAGSGELRGLTNNRYSSDIVSVGDARILTIVPDLPADNALPRWLETVVGLPMTELPDRGRLGMDIDSPLDLELLRRDPRCPPPLADLARSMAHRLGRAGEALDALAALARDPRRELLVSGRLSAAALLQLEERTACRVRALVEERGLRASGGFPGDSAPDDGDDRDDDAPQGPPASLLGLLLDREGPKEIGTVVGRLADGAIIDTRVLMAHRRGADEAAWPSPEDRFASDLLLADRVRDVWLQQLTLHAWAHEVPIALGGHSLVGPGLGLALGITA